MKITTDQRFNGNMKFPDVVAIVFIILKMTGLINWGWQWVLSPIWISALLFILVLAAKGIENSG